MPTSITVVPEVMCHVCSFSNGEMIALLLDNGARVNDVNANSVTALHEAALRGTHQCWSHKH